MIISVDHGNKQIKTDNFIFTPGLMIQNEKPAFSSENNTIFYDGKYITLQETQRIPYMRDKSLDDRYYYLTILAIAKEMDFYNKLKDGYNDEVTLLCGLPPAHYARQYSGFENYFMKNDGKISFTYKNQNAFIKIKEAISYPQGYAAAIANSKRISAYSKVVVVDLGGYTLDYLLLIDGEPELSVCDSLDNGVITLYNKIKSKINAIKGISVDEFDIDNVVKAYQAERAASELATEKAEKQLLLLDSDTKKIILNEVRLFTDDILGNLRERKIDLQNNYFVFVGGGSMLLRTFIEDSAQIKYKEFIDDIQANVKGYKILYSTERRGYTNSN